MSAVIRPRFLSWLWQTGGVERSLFSSLSTVCLVKRQKQNALDAHAPLQMPNPTGIPPDSLVPLGTSPTPVWPDARVSLGPGQGSGCTSWRVDLAETVDPDLYQPPRTLYVRCPMHGMHGRHLGTTLTFSNLLEDSTVWELKAAVDERLMLRPGQKVRLFSWGRELEDDAKTLAEYFVAEKTRLDMQLTTQQPPGERELRRVRVTSTLLQTRQLTVDPGTTVLELKLKIEAAIQKGRHEWWSEDGLRHTVCEGFTWLVVSSTKADPKADLSAVRIGDELCSDRNIESIDRKKGILVLRRVETGRVLKLVEANAILLELPPEKQRLNFHGMQLGADESTLGELGVQQDDPIELEFLSPVTPNQLKIIRAPAPAKKAKAAGGGGKKAKAAGKKKK